VPLPARFPIPLSIRACGFPAHGLPTVFLTWRHSGGCVRTGRGSGDLKTAWPQPIAGSGGVARWHPPRYYDPVGLPLASGRFHHWLIRPVFADEAGETGLSCSEQDRAYVPLPVPRGDPTMGVSGTCQSVGRGPSPWCERLGSPVVHVTRLQDSDRVVLRPARLLPPKRLLTPRSTRGLSTADRGLLPGSPAITRAGLAPAGLVQLSGRNTPPC
jgi:hypothetical protein